MGGRRPKVLIIAGDAADELELFYPYYRLREEGFEVDVAAPSKRDVHTVVHERVPGWDTYVEKPGREFRWVSKALSEVNPAEYDAVYIPGGRMPEHVRLHPDTARILKHFAEAGKIIAAICHGTQVLASLGLLRGKRATGTVLIKPEVEIAGGTFVDENVVVDGNTITGKTWRELPDFMREFMKALRGLAKER